jgi:hypothetical protein
MIGMFTADQNRDRLEAVECALRHRDLSDFEREELQTAKAEIRRWFIDLWLTEGGGVSDG